MARANRILLFEVDNRGNKLAPVFFNEGVAGGVAERNGLTSPGDGWLMRQGYTMVWFGWEMDVRPGMNRVGMPPVVARNHDGSAITGIVRSEMITPAPAAILPIILGQQIQNYPPDIYEATRRRASTIRSPCVRFAVKGRAPRSASHPLRHASQGRLPLRLASQATVRQHQIGNMIEPSS